MGKPTPEQITTLTSWGIEIPFKKRTASIIINFVEEGLATVRKNTNQQRLDMYRTKIALYMDKKVNLRRPTKLYEPTPYIVTGVYPSTLTEYMDKKDLFKLVLQCVGRPAKKAYISSKQFDAAKLENG